MSETNDSTSQWVNSIAERLKVAWFRQTSIARAVTELVWEYMGIHSNIGNNLMVALGNTKSATSEVLWVKNIVPPITTVSPMWPASNNSSHEELKKAA